MENIITAIGNPKINNKLKDTKKYNLQLPDIENIEEIVDVLKSKEDTTILIINFSKIKEENIFKVLRKIKDINQTLRIIGIIEKEDDTIKNILIENGIKDLLIGNRISLNNLETIIDNKITNEEYLLNEINNLKKIILNKKSKKDEIKKYISYIRNKNKKVSKKIQLFIERKDVNINPKVISVIGPSGIGKSLFVSVLSSILKTKKILIIDLDILNKSINTIFDINKNVAEDKEKWKNNFNFSINRISKNISLIYGEEIIIEKDKIDFNSIINELKNKFDIILIDTSSECFYDLNRSAIQNSDISIFLSGANLIELKKTKKLLDIYINEWKIEKEKIKIVFNKYNKNSIDNSLLKEMFKDFKILGNIGLNDNYEYFINNNFKNNNKLIKKEFENIIKKL